MVLISVSGKQFVLINKLITTEKADWKTAVELTNNLKKLDPADPVKYDIALFSLGVNKIQGTRN